MAILNFNEGGRSRAPKNKKFKLIFGTGLLAITLGLSSTLAANININSGPVEFGQGVAQTTACDGNVVMTPSSTFSNIQDGGEFLFTSFTVSDISSACDGKVFTIKAYKDQQSEPLDLYTTVGTTDPYTEIQVLDDGGSFSFVGGGLLADDIVDITNGFTVSMVTSGPPASTAVALANDVDRITIESGEYVAGTPAPVGASYIYVTTDGVSPYAIGRANLDGTNFVTDFSNASAFTGSIITDSSHIYWNDAYTLYKSALDGSSITELFTVTGHCWPPATSGIAVDSTYIYYSDSCTNSIGRAKLDGTERNDSFIIGTSSDGASFVGNDLYGLYVGNNKIFWANYTTNTIGRADIDGTNQNNEFISTLTGGICGVTIQSGYIYWTNFDTNTIGRANLDGSNIDNSYIDTGSSTNPYYIVSTASQLFWTDYTSGAVAQSNLDGSGESILFSYPAATGIALSAGLN